MKMAVVMNALSGLKRTHDTSLALIRRAEAMGWSCSYCTDKDIFCRDGQAFATMHQIEGLHDSSSTLKSIPYGIQPLSSYDIILMRLDPPVDQAYFYTTYALELAAAQGVLVANRPDSLRDVNEKMFCLHFPMCIAPTIVTQRLDLMHAFWEEHRQVVVKPLDGMGGKSVFFIGEDGLNRAVIFETMTQNEKNHVIIQRYIPEIKTQGDKRIILIEGEPIPYALARFPRAGEMRGNLARGGVGKVVEINDRDRWICQQLSPMLREKQLSFVGIDIIGDYLTEINVTSPTCLVEIEEDTKSDISGKFLESMKKNKAIS